MELHSRSKPLHVKIMKQRSTLLIVLAGLCLIYITRGLLFTVCFTTNNDAAVSEERAAGLARREKTLSQQQRDLAQREGALIERESQVSLRERAILENDEHVVTRPSTERSVAVNSETRRAADHRRRTHVATDGGKTANAQGAANPDSAHAAHAAAAHKDAGKLKTTKLNEDPWQIQARKFEIHASKVANRLFTKGVLGNLHMCTENVFLKDIPIGEYHRIHGRVTDAVDNSGALITSIRTLYGNSTDKSSGPDQDPSIDGGFSYRRFDVFGPLIDVRAWVPETRVPGGYDGDKLFVGLKFINESSIVNGVNTITGKRVPWQRLGAEYARECVIFLMGSDNKWETEEVLLKETKCMLHTFDCTGSKTRFYPPSSFFLEFHYQCIADREVPAEPEPMNGQYYGAHRAPLRLGRMARLPVVLHEMKYSRKHLKILKMDVEGWEFPILHDLLDEYILELRAGRGELYPLPDQLQMEVHWCTFEATGLDWAGSCENGYYGFSMERMRKIADKLKHVGYVLVGRVDNRACPHCTEMTFLRYRC